MNIAILIPELGGGGAERTAQKIGDYFVRRGDSVFFFVGHYGVHQAYPVKGKIIKTGIEPLYSWRSSSIFLTRDQLITQSLKIRKLKREYHIDVSISLMEHFNALNVLSNVGDTVITSVRTLLSERQLPGALYAKSMVRWIYNKSDQVVVLSNDGKRDMIDNYGIYSKKLSIIPNFINNDKKNEADLISNRLSVYKDKIIIVIGRLENVKQQDHIIRAFSYVHRIVKNSKLIFLGQGPLYSYLMKTAKNLEVDDCVEFKGFVSDTSKYMRIASLNVMTSQCEGFPNSMIEAMSWGIPVVASESKGGIHEILDSVGVNKNEIRETKYGLMTPQLLQLKSFGSELTLEERKLGEAMAQVLTNQELYMRFCKASIDRAKDYSEDKIMELWEAII